LLDSRATADQRVSDPRSIVIAAVIVTERTSEPPHLKVRQRLRELFAYREIVLNLVRKELKVKYTASVLGAVWSLLNPIVFLAVFSFVVRVTGNSIPSFPVYLLSGLLAWNLFSSSLLNGARSVIENANLVKKVYFPREILPISAVGVAVVDFVLQSGVFMVWILVSRHGIAPQALLLYPLSIVTLLAFTTAITFLVSGLNVRYRDVQHLLGLGLLVWFWMTPIVYPSGLTQKVTIKGISAFHVLLLNPLTSVVLGFQRALYGLPHPVDLNHPIVPAVTLGWLVALLGAVLVASVLFLWFTWSTFFKLSGDFAEEL
jgi:ABC-2 type transport system permease protein